MLLNVGRLVIVVAGGRVVLEEEEVVGGKRLSCGSRWLRAYVEYIAEEGSASECK